MRELQADVAVFFRPKDARSRVLYNVPLNTKRAIKLDIRPKVGDDFTVDILQPQACWLRLSQHTGTVPFTLTLAVDTTGLEPVTLYQEDLTFTVNGVEIHREPIYLSTQLYDPTVLQGSELVPVLNPGKKKKNILITMLTGLQLTCNFVVAIGFLYVLLLVAAAILLFITIVANN